MQVAQAQELIHALRNLTIPVVICGDFNSDANRRSVVEDTPTVDLFEAAGYTEAWPATHAAAIPGSRGRSTWRICFLRRLPSSYSPTHPTPLERIDLFFSKGMTAVGSELVDLARWARGHPSRRLSRPTTPA